MNLHEFQGKELFAQYGLPYQIVKLFMKQKMHKKLVEILADLNGLLKLKFMLVEGVKRVELS